MIQAIGLPEFRDTKLKIPRGHMANSACRLLPIPQCVYRPKNAFIAEQNAKKVLAVSLFSMVTENDIITV